MPTCCYHAACFLRLSAYVEKPSSSKPTILPLLCPTVHSVLPALSSVSVLQPRCSFEAVPALVPDVLTELEAVASRAIELAEASQEAFLTQPLLTAVSISCSKQQAQPSSTGAGSSSSSSSSMSPNGAGDVDVVDGGCLVLTLVEPDARVKVEVALRLRDLLAHAHPGEHTQQWGSACGMSTDVT